MQTSFEGHRKLMRLVVLTSLLICAVQVQAQRPIAIVGQPKEKEGFARFDFNNPFAQEVLNSGSLKVLTLENDERDVQYAIQDGTAPALPKQPTEKDLLAFAKAMKVQYAIWLEPEETRKQIGNEEQAVLSCKLTLYKNGKKVFSDDQTQSVLLANIRNDDQTIEAIVNTLVRNLAAGPWKEFKFVPRVKSEPTQIKGQAPIILESRDDDPLLNDFKAIQVEVDKLISENRLIAAETLLRDAVDADPLSKERRMALINFLRRYQKASQAVSATVQAASVLGDPSLVTMGARILLDNDQKEEAKQIINDAMALNSESPQVRLLMAEVRLRESNPEQALKHLEVALKAGPTVEGFALRAVCRAFLGSDEGVKIDIERVKKEQPDFLVEQYPRLAKVFDEALAVEGPDLRSLFQKAVLNRKSEEVGDLIDAQERLTKASMTLFNAFPSSPRFFKSHELRLLALNLLQQTMIELREYVTSGSEDSLNDARIDLGEFLLTLKQAQEEFIKERKDASTAVTSGSI